MHSPVGTGWQILRCPFSCHPLSPSLRLRFSLLSRFGEIFFRGTSPTFRLGLPLEFLLQACFWLLARSRRLCHRRGTRAFVLSRIIPSCTSVEFMSTKFVAALVLLSLVAAALAGRTTKTALDNYVNTADSSYSWTYVNSIRGNGFTTYNINLTSQTWTPPTGVSISVWTHWLQVCVPDNVRVDCTPPLFIFSPLLSFYCLLDLHLMF